MRLAKGFLDAFKDFVETEPEKDLGNGMVEEERTMMDKMMGRTTVKRKEKEGKPYKLADRGVEFDDDDVAELRNVLYSEISNRDPEKQKMESRVILNTALNRMGQYRDRGRELTLGDVLREPNQYQGYMPDNEKSQYNVARSGKGDKKKLAAIDEVIQEVISGKLEDTTNGAVYYIHHPDGRIEFDDKKPLFADG